MITDYVILSADAEHELQHLVKQYITEWGWQPIGGVHSIYWVSEPDDGLNWDWSQAMVKYEDK